MMNRAVLLLATMLPQAAVSMLSMVPPVMAAEIATTLDLPAEMTGTYIGLVYLGAMSSTALSARLITLWGPMRVSFACMVAGGAGLVLLAQADRASALLATLAIGLSYGPLTPASSQALARYGGESGRALLVSIRQTSVPFGGILAGLIAPPILLAIGWRPACIVIGAATAALGLGMALLLPGVRREAPDQPPAQRLTLLAPIRFVLGRPALISLGISSFSYAALQMVLGSFLVVYLTTEVGLGLVEAGAMLSVSQLAGVAGRVGWGYVADRVAKPRHLLFVIAALMAVGCILMATLTPAWPVAAIAAAVMLLGGTASGWNGVFLAEIMQGLKPAEVGLATSGGLLLTYLGIVIGPPLFGAAVGASGYGAAFLLFGTAVLCGGTICVFWRR